MIPLRHITRFTYKPKGPYDFQLTVKKPAGWSWFTPYEVWENGTIWSGFWSGDIPIGVKARSSGKTVAIDIYSDRKLSKSKLAHFKDQFSQSLGMDEDLQPFYRLIRKHEMLKSLVKHLYGMHEGWGMNIFSSLTLAILLQMAPIKRSEEMWHCLIERHGKKIRFDGKSILLWPDEKTIAKQDIRKLAKDCKLGYRAKFLVKMAKQISAGFPGVEELAKMSPEQANEKLQELFGVGEYTAGFANPHPTFTLDVWSIKIFYPIIFGKKAPAKDPRSGIEKASVAAEKLWGDWRNYVLVYVLNDLPYLGKKFGIQIE